MSGAKEIRGKIKSIKNTQKITKAMEMVAASKMRKAQDRMAASRPYADRIQHVIGHLAQANPDFQHPLLVAREEIRRVGYLIVSTDRGLCGGLNNNLFKQALAHMMEMKQAGAEIDLSLIGAKSVTFFRRFGARIVSQISHLGDTPRVTDLIGSVKLLLDAYAAGELDAVYLVHNVFVSTMSQQPTLNRLLPVEAMDSDELQTHWDYIYEPSAAELLDDLLNRYTESQVYRGVLDNIACEQAARMVAMKAATDNAGELIDNLQLIYNKARQAAITQELSEIVSGAAAV
jgi:F-type H+-transporting ATPase subunit gamma